MNGWIILIIVFVLFEGVLITYAIRDSNQKEFACKELGFEDYKNIDGMRYCEDTESNLHYIKMDCKPWYWQDCTAKTISVGDVRVR